MKHLGRTPGNLIPGIFQKYLTGHPKGAAAAWMLNGALQVLETGIIPGNRNCDNVEDRLSAFSYLIYPSKSIKTEKVKSVLLKSFGFGQAGGEILVIHPDYLFAMIQRHDVQDYEKLLKARQEQVYAYYHQVLVGKRLFVPIKSEAPYSKEKQNEVYLNPLARASFDGVSYKF